MIFIVTGWTISRSAINIPFMSSEIRSLKQLLDRIRDIDADHDPVPMRAILESIGRRSFGPIMLLTGLIILAPLVGDIPGVPTLMGIIILLTASQLLIGRDLIWMPGFILNRSVTRGATESSARQVGEACPISSTSCSMPAWKKSLDARACSSSASPA